MISYQCSTNTMDNHRDTGVQACCPHGVSWLHYWKFSAPFRPRRDTQDSPPLLYSSCVKWLKWVQLLVRDSGMSRCRKGKTKPSYLDPRFLDGNQSMPNIIDTGIYSNLVFSNNLRKPSSARVLIFPLMKARIFCSSRRLLTIAHSR